MDTQTRMPAAAAEQLAWQEITARADETGVEELPAFGDMDKGEVRNEPIRFLMDLESGQVIRLRNRQYRPGYRVMGYAVPLPAHVFADAAVSLAKFRDQTGHFTQPTGRVIRVTFDGRRPDVTFRVVRTMPPWVARLAHLLPPVPEG